MIKERINKIKEYFKEMQIVTIDGEQVIYVAVSFPYGWVIDEYIEDKFKVTVNGGNEPGLFYFATEIDNGEDTIFNAIEYNIEKMKDAIERAQLLKNKVAELKNLFQDENISLQELRTLKFTWDKMCLIENPIDDKILIPHDIEKNDDNFQTDNKSKLDDETIKEIEKETTNNKKHKK